MHCPPINGTQSRGPLENTRVTVMQSALNWFEIPVVELPRAVKFYESILDTKLRQETFGQTTLAIMKAQDPGVAGALVLDAQRKPNTQGTVVYLNANGRLDQVI